MKINTKLVLIISTILSGVFSILSASSIVYVPLMSSIHYYIGYPVYYPFHSIVTSFTTSRLDPTYQALDLGFAYASSVLVFFAWFVILYLVFFLITKIYKIILPSAANSGAREKFPVRFLVICLLVVIGCAIPKIVMLFNAQLENHRVQKELVYESPEHKQQRKDYAKSYEGSYFNIPEMEIKFKVPSQLQGLKYSVVENTPERVVVGLSTETLSTYAGCGASDKALGTMFLYRDADFDTIKYESSFIPFIIQIPKSQNPDHYHPYYPYNFGDLWYFYKKPEQLKFSINQNDEGFVPSVGGIGGWIHTCSNDRAAAAMQVKAFEILTPALATTFPISEDTQE